MLHSYTFSNFQSFREKTKVDLRVSQKTALTDWMTEASTGERLSKLMAIIGPNGSGKTALLKPLPFLNWFVAQSFQAQPEAKIPFSPHFAAQDQPSEFEVLLDFDDKLWRYELRCTQDRVLYEALYQRRERFNYVFVREWDAEDRTYKVKQQDFGMPAREARKVRANASLISTAAQYGVPLASRLASAYVVSNVHFMGRRIVDDAALESAAQYFSTQPDHYAKMSALLAAWDLGLSDVEIREIPAATPEEPTKTVRYPFGRHKGARSEVLLPFALESSGTQSAFVLLSHLLQALEIGGLAVIDEFENDLHPYMLEPILDLFSSPMTNPRNAQIIFTCHAVEVLNLLHKSQVSLVEKDTNCESSACRLDEVEGIRNDDNYYAKYMAGAYGAVPNF